MSLISKQIKMVTIEIHKGLYKMISFLSDKVSDKILYIWIFGLTKLIGDSHDDI